ncbi:polyprenyl synthetase family protein [Amycolatopsis sp. NPDC006125]|uniref:polyprenyl synthetase family protein n=1 Tax=Amycolatopsis sp. NPDC006125 TaxID=3156730 RepID=UPI0033B7C41A
MSTDVSFPSQSQEFSDRVTNRLRYLARGIPANLQPAVTTLLDRPGKRLRTHLLYTCAGFGASAPGRLERAAAVVELMHVASLLHDDIVDCAAERRGVPAAHARYGPQIAVLAGLACFSAAGMEAADLGPGAYRVVTRAAARLAHGQVLDLERAFDTQLDIEDYVELAASKTGELFGLCAHLGAAEARCRPEILRTVVTVARHAGVAFQILDDCLDIETATTGKPHGTDLLRGLLGAPVVLALAADSARTLQRNLLDPDLTDSGLPALANQVERLGGLAAAHALATERLNAANAELNNLPESPARAALHALLASLENPPA